MEDILDYSFSLAVLILWNSGVIDQIIVYIKNPPYIEAEISI